MTRFHAWLILGSIAVVTCSQAGEPAPGPATLFAPGAPGIYYRVDHLNRHSTMGFSSASG